MSFRHQKTNRILSPEQKSRDGRIRGAWLGICWPLKCRPTPRSPWDGAARAECAYTPWEPMQGHIRNAVEAAVASRNPHVIRDVQKRVEVYFSILAADALAPIPRNAECVLELSQSVSREHSEANAALQRVLSELPNPAAHSLEAAYTEVAESQSAGAKCLDFLSALVHKNTRPHLRIQA